MLSTLLPPCLALKGLSGQHFWDQPTSGYGTTPTADHPQERPRHERSVFCLRRLPECSVLLRRQRPVPKRNCGTRCRLRRLHKLQATGVREFAMISVDRSARVGKSAERRHPRFKVECDVHVRCGAAELQGHVLDVSESGIAIHIFGNMKPGERVILQFVLPNSEHHFGVQATVKYSNGSRHGLEFHKLPRHESDELWRICRALSATA
ncbi:MAG: hypothetical protein DMG60_19350 [Acidobacteria bacterium]|nr:MAG: hypothetical protein DMG60_19350 [Acidobacteriota bacterium]